MNKLAPARRQARHRRSFDVFRHRVTAVALACAAISACGADAALFVPLDPVEAARFAPLSLPSAPANTQAAAAPEAPDDRWLVRVDRQRLFRTIHAVDRRGSDEGASERLVLNVAEGFSLEVAAERTRRTLSGHSLSGRVIGVPGSAVTFAVDGETIIGTVWMPKAIYEVFPLQDGVHVFRKVDPSAALPLGAPIVRPEGGEEQLQQTTTTRKALRKAARWWTCLSCGPRPREGTSAPRRRCAPASICSSIGPTTPTNAAAPRCD